MKKIVKAIFNIVIILMIILICIIGYNFIQINFLNKMYSNFFGYTVFEVTTGSMSGTIEINDIILVQITKDVKKGDIVTYINNQELITHRIVEESNNQIITKGDANNGEDKPIDKSMIIGKVVKVFPKIGIWIKVFSDFKVIIPIIVTITLFGFAVSSEKEIEAKEETSFSRFMKNRRERKNGKSKEKKKS